jgi:hypothetical protein
MVNTEVQLDMAILTQENVKIRNNYQSDNSHRLFLAACAIFQLFSGCHNYR